MADEVADIAALLRTLEAARSEFRIAASQLAVVRSRDINARNDLNAAQFDIDRWYEAQRNDAPCDTDWARSAKPTKGTDD